MDEDNQFDSVQWQRDPEPQQQNDASDSSLPPQHTLPSRPAPGRSSSSHEVQAGEDADGVDLAGIGADGSLEVTVDTPLKENDGTKDAYVSYLVSTHVSTTVPRYALS